MGKGCNRHEGVRRALRAFWWTWLNLVSVDMAESGVLGQDSRRVPVEASVLVRATHAHLDSTRR